MISFVEGIVEAASPLAVILNCNGIGYRIEIPITTAEKLPGIGGSIRLHVHPVYREDSQALYGFINAEERDFFHLVTSKVSGIGPKIALNLLSRLSFQLLREAIARNDAALLAKCPGIGKKTAERLCIELKDKLGLPKGGATTPVSAGTLASGESPSGIALAFSDAIQALMALGYKMDVADKAVRKASQELGHEATTEALVKTALKAG